MKRDPKENKIPNESNTAKTEPKLPKPVVSTMPSLASGKCGDNWDGCPQL